MHPTIAVQIANARVADWRRHAEQATIARAASRSARARRDLNWRAMFGHRTTNLARRTLNHPPRQA
jgi:hypothetical protein